jgi:hypothetical protein
MKRIFLLVLTVIAIASTSPAMAGLFAGYAGHPWGSDLHVIMKEFPGGTIGSSGTMVIYRQMQPTERIKQRMFGFMNNKLSAVSVTFEGNYVKKKGVDAVLAEHKIYYGEGKMDKSKAPHTVSYVWENVSTRINFTYAPNHPEMCVVNYSAK